MSLRNGFGHVPAVRETIASLDVVESTVRAIEAALQERLALASDAAPVEIALAKVRAELDGIANAKQLKDRFAKRSMADMGRFRLAQRKSDAAMDRIEVLAIEREAAVEAIGVLR